MPVRAALAALATLLCATLVRAQDPCDDGGLLRGPREVTPAVGALGVTIDAPVVVRYSTGYFGADGPGDDPASLVELYECPATTLCSLGCERAEGGRVAGNVQVFGDRLFFVPARRLAPLRAYVGIAHGLDGDLEIRFCTGSLEDTQAPSAPELIAASPDASGAACEAFAGGRRIGLRLRSSRDDGPGGSIEYLLYLTRGNGIGAPQLRDRFRNLSPDEVVLRLLLTEDEAVEPVCVRIFAVDGVGNLSPPTPEHCIDPMTSAAFQPLCALGAARAGARHAGAAGMVAALVLAGPLLVAARRRARGLAVRAGSAPGAREPGPFRA